LQYVRIEPTRAGGMRFSNVEIQQILLAVGALTLAFALAMVGGLAGISDLSGRGEALLIGIIVLSSFVAVITAFLLHELAHKAVAQRYGCFAEFRAYPMGLFLGIVTAALGFLFAAPGAVMISGPVNARQHVRISAAGPGTNLVIATAFLGVALAIGSTTILLSDLVSSIVGSIAFVNLFLGGFNLVPFPPLDGAKIFAFDKPVWVGMVAALAAVGYVGWRLGLFF